MGSGVLRSHYNKLPQKQELHIKSFFIKDNQPVGRCLEALVVFVSENLQAVWDKLHLHCRMCETDLK